MGLKDKIKNFYETKYKLLIWLPILLLAGAIVQIGFQTITTGDFVNKGIGLKGGSTITFTGSQGFNIEEIETFLKDKYPGNEISLRTLTSAGQVIGIAIDSDIQDSQKIDELVKSLREKMGLAKAQHSVEVVGSSLGESFFRQTMVAMLLSFLLMAIVVFVYFRNFIPSLIIVLCAFSDIIVTLSIFNLTGMKLATGGIAAFLMLIGYSVDTDMLLTTRVLKRKEGTIMERIYSSITTGMTMTLTTLTAVLVAIILVNNEVIKQIMIIIFIGLIVDMIMTWIQNVSLMRMFLDKKEDKDKLGVN